MDKISETFFTTVGCMDGRVQEPVIAFGRAYFGAKYPDTITRAGLDGELSIRQENKYLLDSMKKKLDISINTHHSKGVIVHGHEDCAGNQVDEDTHKDNIRSTIHLIKELTLNAVPVVGVFVKRDKKDSSLWVCEEVSETLLS